MEYRDANCEYSRTSVLQYAPTKGEATPRRGRFGCMRYTKRTRTIEMIARRRATFVVCAYMCVRSDTVIFGILLASSCETASVGASIGRRAVSRRWKSDNVASDSLEPARAANSNGNERKIAVKKKREKGKNARELKKVPRSGVVTASDGRAAER